MRTGSSGKRSEATHTPPGPRASVPVPTQFQLQSPAQSSPNVDLSRLRPLVRSSLDSGHFETAIFWADKIMTLSGGDPTDVYWMAFALFQSGQYHRAAHLIQSRNLDSSHLALRLLTARCLAGAREWQRAIDLLEDEAVLEARTDNADVILQTPVNKLKSSLALLKGQAYEALENRSLAAENFRVAILEDVFNFEAFELLVSHHMLTAEEEAELLLSLPLKQQCCAEEVELIRFLYENRLKKYDKPAEMVIPSALEKLEENLDVCVNLAERHYYNCDIRESHNIASAVLSKDPYHAACLPLHIAILVELNKSNDLFYLAHTLVDLYPGKPVSWFAVGCYYMLVNKHETARRFLSKATSLDRVYGPAWLAFGHSFAAENEHDQAMAAYFTASQVMRGCHLPVLYIGLEYGLTNNPKLAERFFTQALSVAPSDPFVLHEMGVIAFQNGDYSAAEKMFKEAFQKVHEVTTDVTLLEKWEPLLNNLGHAARKLKKYDESLEFHRKALVLVPQNPSTLSSIGFVHLLMFNASQAVDYFHKALGIRRDDTFSSTMLEQSLEMMLADLGPHEGESVPSPDEVLLTENVPPKVNASFSNLNDDDAAIFRSLKEKNESKLKTLDSTMEDASTVSMDLQ